MKKYMLTFFGGNMALRYNNAVITYHKKWWIHSCASLWGIGLKKPVFLLNYDQRKVLLINFPMATNNIESNKNARINPASFRNTLEYPRSFTSINGYG